VFCTVNDSIGDKNLFIRMVTKQTLVIIDAYHVNTKTKLYPTTFCQG